MDLEKYIDLYLEEGRDHVAGLRALLPPDGQVPADSIQNLFRHAHSLKGMAASMGFEATTNLSHALEDLLGRWREGETAGEASLGAAHRAVDILDALLDRTQAVRSDEGTEDQMAAVRELVAALRASAPLSPPEPLPPPGPATPPVSVRGPTAEPLAEIQVTVDPSSPMPGARLVIVAQRIRQSHQLLSMEPPAPELQKGKVHTALFRVPASSSLKDLARSLRELPDVVRVELDSPPTAAPDAGGRAPLVQSVRVKALDLDHLLASTSDLLTHLNQLESGLDEAERRHHRLWLESHRSLLNRLFDRVLQVRLVPFETLTQRLERTARDLAFKLGKPLKIQTSGADQMADRNLLEKLLDPLTHLVRNALDHGLETQEERRVAGKPAEGSLELTIRREAEALLLDLSDDGRGLDIDSIRRRAVERGLVPPAAAGLLGPTEILNLITLPSFSTKEEVTELSGRGVGLDVVRANIESLGGRLEVDSEPGRGCRFSLVIPAAVTLTEVLVFRDGKGVRFAVPTSQIAHLYPLAQHPVIRMGGRRFLQAGDALLPILPRDFGSVDREGCGLHLLGPSGDRVVLVPEVLQSERVMIQPLGPPLEMVPEWIGAAHLSTGFLAYVLDGRAMARASLEAEAPG